MPSDRRAEAPGTSYSGFRNGDDPPVHKALQSAVAGALRSWGGKADSGACGGHDSIVSPSQGYTTGLCEMCLAPRTPIMGDTSVRRAVT